eukprot:COSAG02_NODE_426_length_22559_cov_5.439403_8_plen_45_part_00
MAGHGGVGPLFLLAAIFFPSPACGTVTHGSWRALRRAGSFKYED